MTTVVIGAGAIGLLLAGRLAAAGSSVALLARPRSAPALAQSGIRVRERGAERTLRPAAVFGSAGEFGDAQQPQLAIVCVKGYDTAGTIPALEQLNPGHILTLQNGIGNEETLIGHFGPERIISGVITTSVEVAGTGEITVTKTGGVGLASTAGQPLDRWVALLSGAGFDVRTYADYKAMKWSKALLNMLGNATAAILDMSVEEVYADGRLVGLERGAFREALAVMDRRAMRPVNLPRYPAALLASAMRNAPTALLDPLLRRMIAGGRGGKAPSLQLDLQRGNTRSEGAYLYGAIARAADEEALPAPANHALWSILSGIADGTIAWESYRRNPERLLEAAQMPPRRS